MTHFAFCDLKRYLTKNFEDLFFKITGKLDNDKGEQVQFAIESAADDSSTAQIIPIKGKEKRPLRDIISNTPTKSNSKAKARAKYKVEDKIENKVEKKLTPVEKTKQCRKHNQKIERTKSKYFAEFYIMDGENMGENDVRH